MAAILEPISISPEQAKAEQDRLLASRSLVDFLDHVYILEAPQPGAISGGGKIPFIKWPHLIDFAHQLERPWQMKPEDVRPEDRQTVLGKSRQMGASWTIAAFAEWLALFKHGAVVPMTSQGEVEAGDLLAKVQFIHDNLPESWRLDRSDSKSEMQIYEMESIVRAMASTVKAGRSLTGTAVIMDEADYHEYLREAITSLKPVIDAGGQLVLLSTVDKRKAVSTFQSIYKECPENGYTKLFFGCFDREGRDEQWYEDTMRSIPIDDLKGLNREQFMAQEYPRSEEEMLAPSETQTYFDYKMMMNMQQFVINPIETDGPINFYQKWVHGHRYTAATDTSHGTGYDNSVTVVWNITLGKVVADICSNTMDADDLVYWSMKMLEEYKWPIWGIENNDYGRATARRARDEKYKDLFYQVSKAGIKNDEPGWHTTSINRWDIFGDLKELVDAGNTIIPSFEGMRQFLDVVTETGKKMRPEARGGANDDYPISVGIAIQMIPYAKKAPSKGVPMPQAAY